MALVAAVFVANAPSLSARELTVTCTVSTTTTAAAPVEFGLVDGALDGIDSFDEPLPPAAPDQSLQVYLQMLTPPVPLPNRWRRDLRPFFGVSTDRVELWPMAVECPSVGQMLTFTVAVAIADAPPYSLHLLGPGGLYRLVAPGDVVEVPCAAPIASYFWELQYDEQVAAPTTSWSDIQATFR